MEIVFSLAFSSSLPFQEIFREFQSKRNEFRDEVRYRDKSSVKIDDFLSSLTSFYLAAYIVSSADFNQVLRAPKDLISLSYTVCPPP